MQEIMEMIEMYVKSVNELDHDLINKVWDDSLKPSFVHPRGYSQGLDNIVTEFYTNTMGLFSSRELRPRDIDIAIHGDSALAFFYWEFTAYFKDSGERLDTKGRETQYFCRINSIWKLVHVHYSGMPITGEREGF